MPYFIYRLTAPSGKVYIGVSKNVAVRWSSHKKRARTTNYRHPLYDALRSHGADSFTCETIGCLEREAEALQEEIRQIELHGATDRLRGYNVSRGGEYDGAAGAAKFWEDVKSDLTAFAEYRARLSAGCKRRGGVNLEALFRANAEMPAKERWKHAYRASRMARWSSSPAKGVSPSPERLIEMSIAGKAAWAARTPSQKKKHSMRSRQNAFALWSRRTDAEKSAIFNAISETLKVRYANDPQFKAANVQQLVSARQNINRAKQGPAASRGLKRFWEKLKADPVEYARYIAARKSTLHDTNQKKGPPCEK